MEDISQIVLTLLSIVSFFAGRTLTLRSLAKKAKEDEAKKKIQINAINAQLDDLIGVLQRRPAKTSTNNKTSFSFNSGKKN